VRRKNYAGVDALSFASQFGRSHVVEVLRGLAAS
jgi:hypothetical protein